MLDDSNDERKNVSEQASEIGSAFEEEVEWRYVTTIFTLSGTEFEEGATEVARIAKNGGAVMSTASDWMDEGVDVLCLHPPDHVRSRLSTYRRWSAQAFLTSIPESRKQIRYYGSIPRIS